jgi:hypothetical protein
MSVADNIRKKLGSLPHKPGIYLMRDRFGTVIYVGKARDLRKRVSHYFQPSRRLGWDLKFKALIEAIHDFDFHVVRSEPEALLLESKLIKEFHPRYNVSFRDDKRFLMVKVNLISRKATSYGFTSRNSVHPKLLMARAAAPMFRGLRGATKTTRRGCLCSIAADGVEHSVNERDRFVGGKLARKLQRFVDHHGSRRTHLAHFVDGQAQDVPYRPLPRTLFFLDCVVRRAIRFNSGSRACESRVSHQGS